MLSLETDVIHSKKDQVMSTPDFQHIRTSMVKEIAVVEIVTKDITGPKLAQELSAELAQVTQQEWAKRLLVDFRRVRYLSSTGFAVLFGLATRGKAAGREVRFCNMDPEVRVGADIVGLGTVVEIHDSEDSALKAFSQP
jgi:anti-sigma B factor antagonist